MKRLLLFLLMAMFIPLAMQAQTAYLMPTSGSDTITTSSGILYDDGGATGDYSNGVSANVVIIPSTLGTYISLVGDYELESGYDYLVIYDGIGTSGTVLATTESAGTDEGSIDVISLSGPITVEFYSDGSTTYSGFALTISEVSCSVPYITQLSESLGGAVINVSNTLGAPVEYVVSSTPLTDSALAEVSTEVSNDSTIVISSFSFTMGYFYCRILCDAVNNEYSSWVGISFSTMQLPATLPYACTFETDDREMWSFKGVNSNKWYVGSAVNSTPNGNYSLYVSQNNGVSNTYAENNSSVAWAYRDIDLGNYTAYNLEFDFIAGGETCCDAMQVFIGDTTLTPLSMTCISLSDSTHIPTGATRLGALKYQLTNNAWEHVSLYFDSTVATGLTRLYFFWRNDGSVATQPSVAVDNILVNGYNCARPTNLATTNVTLTTIDITFHSENVSEWQTIIVPYGASLSDNLENVVVLTDTTYQFTDLTANTPYNIYVRSICGVGDTSLWTGPLLVRTSCPSFETIPFAENFDTYSTGSTAYPTCWEKLGSGTLYVNSSSPNSRPGALYFYTNYSNYVCAITPQIDTNVNPINTLTVNFKLRKTSNNAGDGAIQVGVMSDPMDYSSFVALHTITGNEYSANVWTDFEIPLSQATSGSYIALRKNSSSYTTTYLDDFQIYTTPSCLRPISIEATQITTNSITIGWETRNSESAWQVVAVPTGTSMEDGVIEDCYANPYTITNLTEDTAYDIYVRANCDAGGYSPWSLPATISTYCLPTEEIPYYESFETYGTGEAAFPSCWTKATNHISTNFPYITDSRHADNVGSLYFYSTSSYYAKAFSQAIDLTNYPANSLRIRFKALRTGSSYGRLDVGITTNPLDDNAFVLLKSIYPSDFYSIDSWEEFEAVIPNAYGVIYLAFVAPMEGTSFVYVDQVEVSEVPMCYPPTRVSVERIAGASALVRWNEALVPTTYTVEYTVAGDDNWTIAASALSETSYILSNLTQNTNYEVRVVSDCSQDSVLAAYGEFTTGCLAGGSVAIGNGSTEYSYLPTYTFYKHSFTQQIFTSQELGGQRVFSGISLQHKGTSSYTRNWKVYLMHTSTANLSSGFLSMNNAELVYRGTVVLPPTSSASQGWFTVNFSTPFSYNGNDNVVLIVVDSNNAYSSGHYFMSHTSSNAIARYIQTDSSPYNSVPTGGTSTSTRNNVVFLSECDSLATCIAPNVMVTNVTPNSVTLNWAPGYQESSWELEYKSEADSVWTSVGTINSAPYTISNLTSNMNYNIRMRSDCGGEYSSWANFSVFVPCVDITTLPYVETFEQTTGSGSAHFVSCWTRGYNSSTAYPYTSNTYANQGTYSLYFSATSTTYSYAATSRFDDAIEMDNLLISFYVRKSSAAHNIQVGIMTDPEDYSTFTLIETVTPSVTNTWEQLQVSTESYVGSGHYVAFRIPAGASNYLYIDDIMIQELTDCGQISNLATTAVLNTSISISWTPANDEAAWEMVYAPIGTVDLENTVPVVLTDTVYDIMGLSANTTYSIFIRPVCNNGSTGTWASINVRTECDIISTLPYTENFDSYGTGSTIYPDCWDRFSTYSSTTAYPYISTTNHSAPGSIYFYASSNTYTMAIVNAIDATTYPINTLQATFWFRPTTTSVTTMIVGVMSDPTDGSTFVPVDTIEGVYNVWDEHTVYFSHYTGTGNQIAFKMAGTSSYTAYGYLDDVTIDVAPTCLPVYNINASNITTTSTTLSWSSRGNETAWNIEYGPTGFTQGQGTTINATSNPYTLTGLTSGTLYDVYVQADCGNGDFASVVQYTFATECDPITLPYTENFDSYTGTTYDVAGSTPLCWTTITNNTSYPAPHVIGSGAYHYTNSAPNALVFTAGNAGNEAIAVLPEFNTTATELDLAFAYKMENTSYGVLTVGYVTDMNNISTSFTTIETITSSSVVTLDTVLVSNLPANVRLAFRWTHNTSYYSCCIDDIYVGGRGISTPCDAPTNVVATPAQTTANVTWTSNASAWVVEYKVATATNWTASAQLSTPTYNITGLNPATDYVVRVKSICENGNESAWSTEVPFTTLAGDVTTYTITASATGPGTITPNGTVTVQEGDNATFTFAANANAVVAQVLVDAAVITTPADNSYTFSNVVANHTIEVVFEEDQTGINDMNMDAAVALYPNPATSEINIQMVDNRFVGSTMQVYDVYGKLITTSEIVSQSVRLDVSAWANGVYIVRINSNEGIVTKRFVKR